MIEYTIKTEPFEFIGILKLNMIKEINKHGILTIEGYIEDENEDNYLKLLMEECWVKVEAVGKENDKNVIFWGIVQNFKLGADNDQKILKLIISSGSWLLDRNKHIRTFQNLEQSYSDIFKQLILEYKESGYINNGTLDKQTAEFIIQYHETDWEFLKRIASKTSNYITPECTKKGVKIYSGLPMLDRVMLDENIQYKIFKELNQETEEIEESIGYILKMREIHELGTLFHLKNRVYHVYKIESEYVGGELIHTYYIKHKDDLKLRITYHLKAQGASLEGQVTEVKKDKVRISLFKDENKDGISNKWFLFSTMYSTQSGTGWYCMPEIGEKIRLYIPGTEENEAYVISAVYNDEGKNGRVNPDHKIFKTSFGKEIRFTPDEIVITNNQGLRIELLDETGINIISSKSVALEAGEEMTISSGKGSLIIAADTSITMKQQGTEISLQDGVKFAGGEFRIQ